MNETGGLLGRLGVNPRLELVVTFREFFLDVPNAGR